MKTKLKKIIIPSVLMTVFYNISFTLDVFLNFGMVSPHVGILFISGLLFGPYGAISVTITNIILDVIVGYNPIAAIASGIFSFGISLLAYKIWYSGFKTNGKITKPTLDNIYHLILFIADIFICGLIYSVVHGNLSTMIFSVETGQLLTLEYFMNFINISFILGIISIWISKKISFIHTPKTSSKKVNKKFYYLIFAFLIITSLLSLIPTYVIHNNYIISLILLLIGILLFSYLTKPFEYKLTQIKIFSISERIITIFLLTTILIAIFGIILSIWIGDSIDIINMVLLIKFFPTMPLLALTDIIILLFFIPGFIILTYIEKNVTMPITSFSQIGEFIHENEKIESEGLVKIYSNYLNQQDEIGTLARSYTELINYNNHYIENIKEIEGEKNRIEAELDIATRIQSSKLPTEAIETDKFIVNGYSKPAKEVGGDFFDYYEIDDDHLAIMIGDASGKGVPAAILVMITQVIIKQLLIHNLDPSKTLFMLNNQLCENNSESMFITLWLGIYNKTTKKLTFSNSGHNPPLIKENGEFNYLDMDSGVILGIVEDFDFVCEEIELNDEIVIYTDGITDANNDKLEMYGETRLKNFFNKFKSDADPIKALLNDVHKFCQDEEQFDDMTLLYLKIKND